MVRRSPPAHGMGSGRRLAVRNRCASYAVVVGIALLCWLTVLAGKAFGARARRTEGQELELVLRNRRGIEVHLLRTGASIQRLLLPDREGKFADVVLGFDEEGAYSDGRSPYFGAIAGRVANRIANASFDLDGTRYRLAKNERGMPGSLHGGTRGFDKVRWDATRVEPCASVRRPTKCRRGDAVRLSYHSTAGEEGYPGALDVEVTYTLTDDDELIQSIHATTDAPTIVNLAQHSYFNLNGHAAGTVLGHELAMPRATHMLPIDAARIPTGQLAPVRGTAFDFTSSTKLGARISSVDGPGWTAGYDHCFVLHGRGPAALTKPDTQWWPKVPRPSVTLHDPASGRTMAIATTAPGLQLYTSNFLDGSLAGKGGTRYPKYAGVCLETQNLPDAIHHLPTGERGGFPSPVLRPGETYKHTTIYTFSVDAGQGASDEAAA